MSTVRGPLVRSVGMDSFADLVPGVAVLDIDDKGVTFAGPLTAAQVEAVRARMGSRNDADQAARANLAALRVKASASNATAGDVRALTLAVVTYLLGETP